MKNKIILCILFLVCGYSAYSQPNITFTARSATNTAINPQIDISSENGRPFIYGSNLIFASFSIQLTNGFYEIFGLAPGNYVLDIAAWGQRFTMKVPNTTNTYNWLQLINGIYSCSNNSFFITQSEPLPVTLTNPANIFAGAEFTGAFQGDGSGLTNMPYVPLSNFNTVITAGQLIIQDANGIHLLSLQGSNAGGTQLFCYGDGIGGGAVYIVPRQGITMYAPQGAGFIQLLTNIFTIGQNLNGTGATNELPNQTLADTNSILTPIIAAQIPVATNQLTNALYMLVTNGPGIIITYSNGTLTVKTNGSGGGGGSGTVTSISGPSIISWANASTTPTGTLNNQASNTFLRGPNSGSAATPTFGPLVNSDFPPTLAPAISIANVTGQLPTNALHNVFTGNNNWPGGNTFGSFAFTSINGVNKSGSFGVPIIVGSENIGLIVASQSGTLFTPTGTGGLFRISGYFQYSGADSGTVDVTLSYTDQNGDQGFDLSGSQSLASPASYPCGNNVFYAIGGSGIGWAITYTGESLNAVGQVNLVLEQLQ